MNTLYRRYRQIAGNIERVKRGIERGIAVDPFSRYISPGFPRRNFHSIHIKIGFVLRKRLSRKKDSRHPGDIIHKFLHFLLFVSFRQKNQVYFMSRVSMLEDLLRLIRRYLFVHNKIVVRIDLHR